MTKPSCCEDDSLRLINEDSCHADTNERSWCSFVGRGVVCDLTINFRGKSLNFTMVTTLTPDPGRGGHANRASSDVGRNRLADDRTCDALEAHAERGTHNQQDPAS